MSINTFFTKTCHYTKFENPTQKFAQVLDLYKPHFGKNGKIGRELSNSGVMSASSVGLLIWVTGVLLSAGSRTPEFDS